jgi:hypothetical protein
MINYISNAVDDKSLALQDIISTINSNPILNGRLVKNISVLSTADKVIDHGLGRIPNGYIIVSKLANCDLVFKSSTALTITLRASASTTISLWVF